MPFVALLDVALLCGRSHLESVVSGYRNCGAATLQLFNMGIRGGGILQSLVRSGVSMGNGAQKAEGRSNFGSSIPILDRLSCYREEIH